VQDILQEESSGKELNVIGEYDEQTGTLTMRFLWDGSDYDPVSQGDELSGKLILASVTDYSHSYENGKNTLILHQLNA